jgi:hypothetical protein
MAEPEQKAEETKQCELIEFCGDFHPLGKEACEGKKSHDGCPLWQQYITNQYTERYPEKVVR